VTPFIWSRPNQYKSLHFRSEKDLSNWRWTLDDFDDWIFLNSVLEKIDESTTTSEGTKFDYNTIVKLLEDDPSLLALMPQNRRSVGRIISDRIKNA
jgi:spore coat polysaccharide biosynthesis protein SpsF (cytidylyltransferase family)